MNLPNPFPGHQKPVAQATPIVTEVTNPYKFKKAGKSGTLITLVLDESGSMASCWDATISGFNEFVNGQKTVSTADAGKGYLTLIKFDAPSIHTMYENKDIKDVIPLDRNTYRPNGSTNLLDAIGTAINSVNKELSRFKKKHRPGVIITIMTDGGENASRSFNNEQIKQMVKAAEESDWTFTFLGANIDSFAVGSTFGMTARNTVNYSTNNMTETMNAVSASTSRIRSAKFAGTSTEAIYNAGLYTDAELQNMKK